MLSLPAPLPVYFRTLENTLDILCSELPENVDPKKKKAIYHLLERLAYYQPDPEIRRVERYLLDEQRILKEVRQTLTQLK